MIRAMRGGISKPRGGNKESLAVVSRTPPRMHRGAPRLTFNKPLRRCIGGRLCVASNSVAKTPGEVQRAEGQRCERGESSKNYR